MLQSPAAAGYGLLLIDNVHRVQYLVQVPASPSSWMKTPQLVSRAARSTVVKDSSSHMLDATPAWAKLVFHEGLAHVGPLEPSIGHAA